MDFAHRPYYVEATNRMLEPPYISIKKAMEDNGGIKPPYAWNPAGVELAMAVRDKFFCRDCGIWKDGDHLRAGCESDVPIKSGPGRTNSTRWEDRGNKAGPRKYSAQTFRDYRAEILADPTMKLGVDKKCAADRRWVDAFGGGSIRSDTVLISLLLTHRFERDAQGVGAWIEKPVILCPRGPVNSRS